MPEVVVENLRAARQNRAGLARRRKVLALATRGPILLTVLYGLLSLT